MHEKLSHPVPKSEDLFSGGSQALTEAEFLRDHKVISAWLSQKASPRTRVNYQRHIERLFKNFPKRTIKTITSHHIAHHFKNLEKNFCLKRSSIRAAREAISSLYSYCVKSGFIQISENPMNAVDVIRPEERVGFRTLARFQIDRMIEVERNPRNKLLILLLMVTGLRIGEAVSLTRKNFSNHGGITRIGVIGKGGKYRSVICPDWLWAEIETYVTSERYPFSSWTDQLPLFPSQVEPYNAITTAAAWKIVKLAAKRAKITDHPSPHWLRHAHALMSVQAGVPLHVLKASMGHASITTTEKYIAVFPTEGSSTFIQPIE